MGLESTAGGWTALLGVAYTAVGFFGAFVTETAWWRRRTRWPRFSVVLRTLLFLVLVRGVMYLTPGRGWAALAAVAALGAGALLLWLDSRRYQQLAGRDRYGKPQGGGDGIGDRGTGPSGLENR